MNLQETIRKVLREEHEDMHRKFNMFMRRRDSQIKDSIKGSMKIILAAVNANGIDKSKDFVIDAICNSAVILFFNENNLDLGGEEYYELAKIYLKKYYSDYIIEKLKSDKEEMREQIDRVKNWIQFLNENISNTEFIIDDNQFKLLVDNELVSSCYFTILDNYVGLHGMITYEKFLKMGYGKILMKNIFNHVKNKLHMNLIKLSVMNDNHRAIDFYKTLGFISEKDNKNKMNHTMYKELGSDKEEMKEAELTEKCWKGYTQKGMKTMFGKRYPNCVKKKK